MPDFESAVAQFTYTEEERVKGETLRQQFLERFPASSLPMMTLEKYSLGLESKENSFCYWLEFKTRELGSIGGAPASKHVIFYSQERKEYSFPSQYRTKKEAFDAVKSGLLELLRLGAADKFDQCAGVPPFENMNLIRGKVLNMYFPDKFLPIFSLDHLKDFCLQLGVKADFQSQNAMNQALLKFKQQNPLVNGWSNDKFATLLYQKLSPTVQFWKVAPGENAAFWSECYQEGFICVGWKELGDMRQQSEEAAFKEKYREVYGPQRIRQWKEIWAFAKQIKKGDVIVANNGLMSIVGIGTVTGDYWYNENREQYKHCLPIKWDVTTEFPVPDSARDVVADWFQGTVKKISREEYNLLLAGGTASREHQERFPPLPADSRYAQICKTTFLPEKFFADCERLLKIKQQIILQGAPGTGKTFVAEKVAALWAEDSKRVKVVQFHESFGYEDFIYGIKPRVGADGKTAFCPEPGLFLRFCEDEVRKGAPEQNFVLLIDEINRAKTARVFGELLYLLEYRDRKVELQNGTTFSIPLNLYIIGTMNTTDKSIALVDYALRRRFAFIDLAPVKNGSSVVLRKWLDANQISNAAEIDSLFVTLNEAIAQKDEALMVGHSYFMQKEAVSAKRFSDDLLKFLWDYYILPLIAEYEYQLSRSELEERYGLDALRSAARAKAATA